MTHKIPDNVLNSNLEFCISEYVRVEEYRDILRERWFKGKTLSEISIDHHICLTEIKKIIYNIGDKILIRASEMK